MPINGCVDLCQLISRLQILFHCNMVVNILSVFANKCQFGSFTLQAVP